MSSPTSGKIPYELSEVYSLYKTYEKNKTPDGKITDLFLVKTRSGHFEFVKKKSFKGQFLRALDWCENKLHIGKERFVIEKNFAKINDHFQKIFDNIDVDDTTQLDALAKDLGVETESGGKALKESLYELGIQLSNLMHGIEKSRLEKHPERSFNPLPELRLFERKIESSYDQAQKNVEYQKVKVAIRGHLKDSDQINAVTSVVLASRQKDQILEDLNKNDTSSLVTALRETLTSQVAEKDLKPLRLARCFLAPLSSAEPWSESKIEQAVSLFCSSFVKEQKEESLTSIRQLLLTFLENYPDVKPLLENAHVITKDTTPEELKLIVEKAHGPCLLLGGDPKGVAVSQISKQADGTYTIRVYNQEPKRELPVDVKQEDGTQGSGYHEFSNITASQLFSKQTPSFWSRLWNWNASENTIAQTGYIQHLLRAELPGTTASKSLITALVHTMSETEAVAFQFEYNMYLLGIIEKELTALSNQEIPAEYHAIRKSCSEIKAAVDQFAKESQLEEKGRDKILLIYDLLDRIDDKLIECEKQLYTQKLTSLDETSSPVTLDTPSTDKVPSDRVKTTKTTQIQPIPIEQKDLDVLQAIEKMKVPDITDALIKLKAMDPSSVYFTTAVEAFCKKIGSLNAWNTITVDANALQELFNTIVSSINPKFSDKANARCYGAALFIMQGLEVQFRNVSPENRVLPQDFPSTLTCEHILTHVKALRTSDPFWARVFAEIIHKKQEAQSVEVSLSRPQDFELTTQLESSIHKWLETSPMGKKITASIKADRVAQERLISEQIEAKKAEKAAAESEKATNEKTQSKLQNTIKEKTAEKERIEASIIRVRDAKTNAERSRNNCQNEINSLQKELDEKNKGVKTRGFWKTPEIKDLETKIKSKEEEMKNWVQLEQSALDELNKKLNPENARLKDLIAQNERELASVTATIKKLTATIAECEKEINGGIRTRIQNDPQYWPWGLGEEKGWSSQQIAHFYFAQGHSDIFQRKLSVQDVFSNEFRAYIQAQMIATNLFYKTENPLSLPITVGLTSEKKLSLTIKGAAFGTPQIPDLYADMIQNPVHNALYTTLYSKQYVDEASIPNFATVDIQKTVTENKGRLATLMAKFSSLLTRKGAQIVLDDELRELCQLHSSEKIQIDATVSFLQENPKRLFDQDMRSLLEALLFEGDLLLQKFDDPESRELLTQRLAELFQRSITSALELDDVKSAVEIARLAAAAQGQLDAASPGFTRKIYKHKHLCSLFEKILETKDTSKWPILVESLVAGAHHILAEPLQTDQDKKLFIYALTARAMSKQLQIKSEEQNALRRQDAIASELSLKTRLGKMSPDALNALVNEFAPQLLAKAYPKLQTAHFDADQTQGVFVSNDKKTTLSLTEGSLVSSDPTVLKIEKNPLPQEVRDILTSQHFYQNESDMYGLHCSKQDSIVTVIDEERDLTIQVDLKKSHIFVKAKDPMPWCQFLTTKVDCKNSYLSRYNQWCDPESKKLFLIDPETFVVSYESDGTHFIEKKSNLCVLTPPKTSLFSSFEDPNYTLYRGDSSGNIQEIEFTRLNLTLVKNEDGRWEQKGVKNWCVALEQHVPHLEQKTGFIVFENVETKEKKALFPLWDLRVQEGDIGYQFNSQTTHAQAIEYSIQDTKLVCKDPLSRYFLAKLFLAKANIEEAEKLLYSRASAVSSRKLSDEEMHELRQIALYPTVVDTSPRALALRKYALDILKSNEAQFPKEVLREESRTKSEAPSQKQIQAEQQLEALYRDRVTTADRSSTDQVSISLEELLTIRKVPHDAAVTKELAREYFTTASQKEKAAQFQDLFSLGSPQIQDAVTKSTFEMIANDLRVAESTLQESLVELKDGKDLNALQSILEVQLERESNLLAGEQTQIVRAASTAHSSPTIEELCVLFGRKNSTEFIKKQYPQFTDEDCNILKEAIQKYLFQKETVQQLQRSISLIKAHHSAEEQMKTPLLQSIAFSLKQTRVYPPDHPLAMVFLLIETSLNIKLRQDQIQNLLKFDKGILQDEELVLQMIMGAGKTSVIQPILALLLAKPDTLSCVMVPEAQFQSVREKLATTLGTTLDKTLISFPYDRELSDDLAYLSSLHETLIQTKENGGCVLLTSRHKHSIVTSLYEAYYNLENKDTTIKDLKKKIAQPSISDGQKAELSRQLQEIQEGKFEKRAEAISKICNFLQLHERDQIDEIDMIMNPKVVFKRPIGIPQVFDQEEGYVRSNLVTNLLLELASDPTIAKEVSIDFIDAFQAIPVENRASAITESLYLTKVQPKLIKIACEQLSNDTTLKTLMEEHRSEIEHFLSQTPSETKSLAEIRQFIRDNVTDEQSQKLLASCAHTITRVLPLSLLKECNSHYGKDPTLDAVQATRREFIARPYEAPNAPKKTTFADPHEKIAYSVQYFLFAGITKESAKQMLIRWQTEARQEMQTQACEGSKTTRYEQFSSLVPDKKFFTDPSSKEFDKVVKAFVKAAKYDRATLLEFCQTKLFEQVKVYTKDITSTPQTLVGTSNKASGYTGTMHTGILASSMKGIPEIGTDGKTIAAVQEKIVNGLASVEVVSAKQKPITAQIIDKFNKDVSVFIDSGGWLKEENIDEFAKRVLKECTRSDITGIVYHDKYDRLVYLEKRSDVPVPFEHSSLKNSPQNRLTIIAQKYETGTDISQMPNARAFMSVRKNMTLRDALQSMFRMRQVLQGQSVSIGMTEEVKEHIGYEPTATNFWRYVAANQAKSHMDKNWAATLHRMKETVEKPLRNVLIDPSLSIEDRKELFRHLETVFVHTETDTLFESLCSEEKEISAQEIVKEQIRIYLKIYEKTQSLPEKLRTKIENEIIRSYNQDTTSKPDPKSLLEQQLNSCVDFKAIPEKMVVKTNIAGAELETEAERQVEEQKQNKPESEPEAQQLVESEILTEKVAPPEKRLYRPLFDSTEKNYYTTDQFLTNHLKTLKEIVPTSIQQMPKLDRFEYSPNLFLEPGTIGTANTASYHLASRFLFAVKDADGSPRFIFVSHEDAARIQKGLEKEGDKTKKPQGCLYDLMGYRIAGSSFISSNEMTPFLAVAKIATLHTNFSTQEIEALRVLLRESKDPTKLRQAWLTFYETGLRHYPTQAQNFTGSTFQNFLKNG